MLLAGAVLFFAFSQGNLQAQTCCGNHETQCGDTLKAQDIEALASVSENGAGQITGVEALEVSNKMPQKFHGKYVLYLTQPIDHKDVSKGMFKQRVIVCFAGKERPTVIITEGYTANYGMNPSFREEVSKLFNTNIVLVEHRYFEKSVPFMQDDSTITWATLNWDYMTGEQEAADLHAVRTTFGKIFKGKWIATGISKGGENCMSYTAHYPKDIDISVPYVGPVCTGVEDGRHEPFLRDSTGTAKDREIIKNFQMEILKRRATIQPMLEEFSKKNKLEYKIPIGEVYDYCVLEFPFAFWQWGRKTASIPDPSKATDKEMFDFFAMAVGPDYFQKWDANAPFFVQAAKELGYYGYDCKPFKGLLTIKSAKGYLQKIFLPDGRKFKFDPSLSKKITSFVATTDSKMMFIYGQYDPWSSVRPLNPGHENIKYYVLPEGSHRSRISNMPDAMKKEAMETLTRWLAE